MTVKNNVLNATTAFFFIAKIIRYVFLTSVAFNITSVQTILYQIYCWEVKPDLLRIVKRKAKQILGKITIDDVIFMVNLINAIDIVLGWLVG